MVHATDMVQNFLDCKIGHILKAFFFVSYSLLCNTERHILLCISFHVVNMISVTYLGDYGQLGHGTLVSSDQPSLVDFFPRRGLCVEDVRCGPWNTFVSVTLADPTG